MNKQIFLILLVVFLFSICSYAGDDQIAVSVYANKFFSLVLKDDKNKIWNEFAPSSDAKKRYNRSRYLKKAQDDDAVLVDYKIMKISIINVDEYSRRVRPNVKKIALVIIKGHIRWKGNNQIQPIEVEVVFFKENERWWKG